MIYVVSGSREFPDLQFVSDYIWQNVKPYDTLIHGGARGVDKTCGNRAKSIGANVVEVPANWKIYGMAAGAIRNSEMIACVAEHQKLGNEVMALIFWDVRSRGTADFIRKIEKTEIPYKLFTLKTRS